MPILVRPVREQLEHDRIIRLLEAKWRRKFKVEANPGDERNAGVKVPAGTVYPDLVLTEEGGRKPKALVEVETHESVNHLEAMSQWASLAKARTSLLLFVPAGAVEAARRLASENAIKVAELWTYLVLGDQVRFTSVLREDGAEPANLIEKAEVFTTERAAPAPRPLPVEPIEPPAEASAEPERPRKLAVKAAPRMPSLDAAQKASGKAAAPTSPPARAASTPAKGATPAKPAPSAARPVAVPAPSAKAEPARPAVKPAASVKAVPRPAEKKVADRPAEKPPVRKVIARKAEKKAASSAKPATARKPVQPAPKAVARAAAKKAAPARPAARAIAKKAAAKPTRTARRK